MKNRVVYIISSFIFLVMLFIAIPFHVEVTNEIVGKQMKERDVQGLFLRDDSDTKFRPRQYIRKITPKELEVIE